MKLKEVINRYYAGMKKKGESEEQTAANILKSYATEGFYIVRIQTAIEFVKDAVSVVVPEMTEQQTEELNEFFKNSIMQRKMIEDSQNDISKMN